MLSRSSFHSLQTLVIAATLLSTLSSVSAYAYMEKSPDGISWQKNFAGVTKERTPSNLTAIAGAKIELSKPKIDGFTLPIEQAASVIAQPVKLNNRGME